MVDGTCRGMYESLHGALLKFCFKIPHAARSLKYRRHSVHENGEYGHWPQELHHSYTFPRLSACSCSSTLSTLSKLSDWWVKCITPTESLGLDEYV